MTVEEMKKRKQELGYSLKQLSEISGVPASTINKIFNGYTVSPRYTTLQALTRALDNPHKDGLLYKSHPASGYVKESIPAYAYHRTEYMSPEQAALSEILPEGPYTLQDREKLPEQRRTELIHGVLYDMASPRKIHQEITGSVFIQLTKCISDNASTCKAYIAPLDVILGKDQKTVVQPDVFVLCHSENGEYIYSAPELAIEVTSPSTRMKDYLVKLTLYTGEGVKEYWIIDPDQTSVTVYHLSQLRGEDTSSGKIVEVFGFSQEIPVGISHGKCRINLNDFAR